MFAGLPIMVPPGVVTLNFKVFDAMRLRMKAGMGRTRRNTRQYHDTHIL